MAKVGKDIEIVTELENVSLFSDYLKAKNGLVVCETYQEWAGPCVVMKRFLHKAKFEYLEGDDWDLVHYCSIKVEAVPAFKNLKGKCIPTYIFFGGRKPIGIFRGYEPSLLMPLIKEMVRREKLYMAGKAVRPVLSDTLPYAFPEEDPVLPEVVILETPLLYKDTSSSSPSQSIPQPTPTSLVLPSRTDLEVSDSTAVTTKRSENSPNLVMQGSANVDAVPQELTGFGQPNVMQTGAPFVVTPAQTDETGNKAAARAAVGVSPVASDVIANPVIMPVDQAVGNVNAPGGNMPGINETVPGAAQGAAYTVPQATLPEPTLQPGSDQPRAEVGNDNSVTEEQVDESDEEVLEEMPILI